MFFQKLCKTKFVDLFETNNFVFLRFFRISRIRGEVAKLAHLIESASLKRKYMTKNYEKIFI